MDNNSELTSYDRFLLRKMEEEQKSAASRENSAYANYIIGELRRTGPSDKKVMTEEEFSQTQVVERHSKASVGKNAKKKTGLIFLLLYVIIVLALALIVVLGTKKSGDTPGADASAVEPNTVQTMPRDQQEARESENWFDALCDSLN